MYCTNCGNLLNRPDFVCRSCLIPIDDSGLRSDEAERILVGITNICTLVAHMQRTLEPWEVNRIERIRSRGKYSFHSAKILDISRATSETKMPLQLNLYTGQCDAQEELEDLHWEESQKYLAIVAASGWFMTIEFDEDYTDEHFEYPYKIAKALGGVVAFEHDGLEPEFSAASELTELMEDYGLWVSEPDPVPKSRKAVKSWTRDEYEVGYKEFTRADGTEGRLELHAQIFTRVKRVPVQVSPNSKEIKLIGNGWMLTVVGDKRDYEYMSEYAQEVEEYLGCEIEDYNLHGWPSQD